MSRCGWFGLVAWFSACGALGFSPPEDGAGGFSAEISGVPEVHDLGSGPLRFTCRLVNETERPAEAVIRVWLNDDWHEPIPASRTVEVGAGSTVELGFEVRPLARALLAHYAVHVELHIRQGEERITLHPIAVFRTIDPGGAGDGAGAPGVPAEPISLGRGAHRIDTLPTVRYGMVHAGQSRQFPSRWRGHDEGSGAAFRTARAIRGGMERSGFQMHPPYRDGTGAVWCEVRVALPDVSPIEFDAYTAIRDHNPETEPPSDGVEFKVMSVGADGSTRELFRRFSDAKIWEPVQVDLSAFAGKVLQLRLWSGPGPEDNTSCDSGYWGDPTIIVGAQPTAKTEDAWRRQRQQATQLALEAARGRGGDGRFVLRGPEQTWGAGFIAGAGGLVDGTLAFSDGTDVLIFRGMTVEIDGRDCSDWRSGAKVVQTDAVAAGDELTIDHVVQTPDAEVLLQVVLRPEAGALRVSFSMPGVVRDARGHPRFSKLALGPCETDLRRTYLGFGNVIEGPRAPFRVRSGGFGLSTRHVGADYANGLSLLQASDTFPDGVVCAPEQRLFSLETPHDTTFRFIPSAQGSFAAARHYRDLSGFEPGPGVAELRGRMCLDQWGGDYAEAAADLELAARYGLTHTVFVKHVWQRWGYDYRLPDIYPPAGDLEAFRRMAEVCAEHGMLFAPHDNYIDFYPDASGFSYDHIIFNPDGTPQRAWFNKGRQAQSYRWLPGAYMPWLKRNMRLLRDGASPTGLFIDVFSAIKVMDTYDRAGVFHPRDETAQAWCEAFDTSRDILGAGAPMLSEAGHDALIGSLDGAQSDHYRAERWGVDADAFVRTPWHDMASHGRFVLLAGGLGHRYGDEDPRHTYGTDDYLSNTVIGGRNPMSDGPFSRRAVMTYWLLHDVCNRLAHEELETHRFADDSIYRQHTGFSGGSRVWTNRGDGVWDVAGQRLPQYGFRVQTPEAEAGVVLLDGQRAGYAVSPGYHFVDARPLYLRGRRRQIATEVTGGRYLGDGRFEVTVEWTVRQPLTEGTVPFVHITHEQAGDQGERIAHHGTMDVEPARFRETGRFSTTMSATLPPDSYGGTYRLRYGLYNPQRGGGRVTPAGNVEGTRVRGGELEVGIEGGRIISGRYTPEAAFEEDDEINAEGRTLDFGPIATNGAFRLDHSARTSWLLIPLPGSMEFEAELDLAALGAPGALARVEVVDPYDASSAEPGVRQQDGRLSLSLGGDAFAYRLHFD